MEQIMLPYLILISYKVCYGIFVVSMCVCMGGVKRYVYKTKGMSDV